MAARRSPWEVPNGWLKPVGSDLRTQAHHFKGIYDSDRRGTAVEQEVEWARRRGVDKDEQ